MQFDFLSLSLSPELSSLKSKEPDYFRLKPRCFPPSLSGCGTLDPRERNSQTVSFLQRRNVFYTRARVCRSSGRQRGRDTEGVRGIVREHFAARHYPSFCRWLNPEQVTQKLFDVNSGRWYSEDLEQFHLPSPPLLSLSLLLLLLLLLRSSPRCRTNSSRGWDCSFPSAWKKSNDKTREIVGLGVRVEQGCQILSLPVVLLALLW